MATLVTEWVNVTDDVTIISRESGEVWFHKPNAPDAGADPFAKPMTGPGSLGSTVGLLDGAINLGFSTIEHNRAKPTSTIPGYAVALISAYHTSVDTPRNLRRAAKRFEELGRPEVAAYLEVRAREESGHDRLALKDLKALGLPGDQLVANYVPEGIEKLCRRFDNLCVEDYPIGSIGFSYCLERTAALKQESDIAMVKAICPDDVDATRFLRSHSALGSEMSHVEETIEFVASLPANDRIEVVRSTYESALVMAAGYNDVLHRTDAELIEALERAAGKALHWPAPRRAEGQESGARSAA